MRICPSRRFVSRSLTSILELITVASVGAFEYTVSLCSTSLSASHIAAICRSCFLLIIIVVSPDCGAPNKALQLTSLRSQLSFVAIAASRARSRGQSLCLSGDGRNHGNACNAHFSFAHIAANACRRTSCTAQFQLRCSVVVVCALLSPLQEYSRAARRLTACLKVARKGR